MKKTICAMVAAAASFASAQQYIMMPDSTSDAVVLFDPFDGTVVNANYFSLAPSGIANTPINAVQVGSEIWVSDQLGDGIMRFDLFGNHQGNILGAMDNIRGFEVVGNTAYVGNAGTLNGAPGDAVVTIDVAANAVSGSFLVGDDASGDPFDILALGNALLINDIDSDDLELHATNGAWISTFHNSDGSTGVDFPEQMNFSLSGQSVLVAGFSPPEGIYEYDLTGTQINHYAVGTGVRGVWQLGNGTILYSDGSGAYVLDPASGVSTIVYSGSGRYFEPLTIPAPASAGLVALTGLAAARRRR